MLSVIHHLLGHTTIYADVLTSDETSLVGTQMGWGIVE